MDFAKFNTVDKSNEGSWLKIVGFNGEEIGAEFLVLGPDSSEANAISLEQERKARELLADTFSSKGKKSAKASDDVSRGERDTDFACRITKDWKEVEWNGAAFPCTEVNKRTLFATSPFIKEQVIAFYNDRLNFTPTGSLNSK